MNESYNPYEVAPMSRVAAQAPLPTYDNINALNVSATWKRRFRLIERAGGPQMKNFRDLSFGERVSIGFSVLAWLFGPIYFLCKGLWRPAIAYFLVTVAVIFFLMLIGLDGLAKAVGYGASFAYANRACVLYYRKMVLEEEPWF